MSKLLEQLAIPKKETERNLSFTKQDIADFLLSLLGFFMGRVVIFSEINLLGLAFMSTFFLGGKSFYIVSFFTLIGILTKFTLLNSLKYIIAILFLCALNFLYSNKKIKNKNIIQSSIVACAIFFSSAVIGFYKGGYIYLMLVAFLEGVLTFCVSFLLKKGTFIVGGKVHKKTLSSEDLISLSILAGGIVVGSADIFAGNISLRYFLSSLIIMIMCYKGGATMGATCGLLLGILLNLAGFENVEFIVILSVAGLISGSLKELPKQFVAAGFALGTLMMSFYIQPQLINNIFLFSVLFAGITFIIIPEKAMLNVVQSINPAIDNSENYIYKLKELTTQRLYGFSKSFEKLSKTFSGISEKKSSLNKKDINNLIDDVAEKVCSNCEKKYYCWEQNFYNTYQTVFSLLNACEKNGSINTNDIPEEFNNVCIDLTTFTETVTKTFEIYKTNILWHNRIVESRELVSQQLQGVSKIIDNLALELDFEIKFKEDKEQEILKELNDNKIDIDSIVVSENNIGKYEVNITHTPCYNKNICSKQIVTIVNKCLGRKMKRDDNDCLIIKQSGKSVCKLKLIEEQNYRISNGVSKISKTSNEFSGDSFSFMPLRNSNYILALSDGMGSGKKASRESGAAIELLEEFFETGFDKDIAIKMINSVLLLKSSEESFSTLDICSINLYTGEAEFIKIGASSTFILRNGQVHIIRSWSLPVGIVNDIDLDITKKELQHGDIVVMITDGVIDIENNIDEDKELWIKNFLIETNLTNPQDISDAIINEAKLISQDNLSDDMTVIVAKLWSR